MNDLVATGVSVAFADWGSWKARCAWCTSALALSRFQEGFVCWDCGRSVDVVWPSAAMVRGVERLLMMRPAPKTRNWLPTESLSDLLAENVEHGVMVVDDMDARLVILGDRIVVDTYPAAVAPATMRRELV